MRDSRYPDTAQAYYCPFAFPVKMHCLGDDCAAWEDDDDTAGCGDCSLLVRRQEIME